MSEANPATPHAPPRRRFGGAAVALALAVGLAAGGAGAWLAARARTGTGDGQDHAQGSGAGPAAAAAAKPTYVCPMHPSVTSDHPADCPICGMKLVLAKAEPKAASAAGAGGGGAAPPAATGPAKATYVCPMHPSITSDHPADCPICGMKLVPLKDAGGAGGAGGSGAAPVGGLAAVTIDPSRQQLIGLRTAEVTRGPVAASWRTVGRVAVDETRVHHVSVRVSGFIENVYADFVGKPVKAGEPLFSIYSPDLFSVQQEYLLALKTRGALADGGGGLGGAGDDLVASARERLALWEVPASEIQRLERTGKPSKILTFRSPMSGVVTKKDAVMGHRISEGDMPFEITDLSSVWVLADAYETDLTRIRLGMTASLSLQALPDRTFQGKVVFIDPLLDPKTRTAKIRLAFANRSGELRPEMFGEVTLQGKARQGLRVPSDAVIDSGGKKVVFVALGEGKFEPREVRLGAVSGDVAEVLSGVEAGESVVTRANFLVDSESRLRASLSALSGK